MAEIVDAHHHIWRFAQTPWLAGAPQPRIFGDYEPIRRDYLANEFASDSRPYGVTKSVYIQVNVRPGGELEEVQWATEAGTTESLVQGVVAFADLADPNVAVTLNELQRVPTVRGIRQQMHWHPNPAYRFASEPDIFLRPQWQRGLREVTSRGLLFELQIFPNQYEAALRLVDTFPDATFVLLHAGMPDDRSLEGMSAWRHGLAQFARRGNVSVKLSGLGTFVHACSIETWKPIINYVVDVFSPGRCVFGSNFPIEKLWTSYGKLIEVVLESLDDLNSSERQQILHDVAARLYGLEPATAITYEPLVEEHAHRGPSCANLS